MCHMQPYRKNSFRPLLSLRSMLQPQALPSLNKIQIKLPALSVNESMARAAVAAFVSQLDPGVTEIADIKCAVSEAVTNAIVHGYRDTPETGSIAITVSILSGRAVRIEIKDKGCGIPDVGKARQPTDFEYCFAKLKAAGYDGDIAFEITGDDQTVRDAMKFVRDLWNR